MALPTINNLIGDTIYAPPENGNLLYKYSPFYNLKTLDTTEFESAEGFNLIKLRLSAENAEININKPVDINTEPSYDESVNIIVNDRINPIKIVNPRFYLTSSTTYQIADHQGNLDSNIYTKEDFKIESSLIKNVRTIINLKFLGIYDGGLMKVGNYTFYFKLSDSDGNETDFIAESGRVVCHIGSTNNASSIRGGQLNENSDKLIKFSLNNLDLAYDYINIYYTRSTGDSDNEIQKTYKINDKFKISSLDTVISITGFEEHVEIDNSEINIQYTNFTGVQSVENCQNITFAGNVVKNYEIYKTLEKYSLLITPELTSDVNIGNLNYNYVDKYPDTGGEYSNANNIYYKLSYWDEEIYRMGIIYIMPDYTLSPVFNTRGIKLLKDNTFKRICVEDTIDISDDYLIINSDSNNPENSKGVFKIDYSNPIFNRAGSITPIGIKFNFTNNVLTGSTTKGLPGLKDLTRGFFIVRQKRIPTILAQGLGIATSTLAKCPVIKGDFLNPLNNKTDITYFGESFLQYNNSKDMHPKLGRSFFEIPNVTNNALICPEASLKPNIFNNLFNGSDFVIRENKYTNKSYFSSVNNNKYQFYLGDLTLSNDKKLSSNISSKESTISFIEPGIELTRSNNYEFSSRAGSPNEAWKHLDPVLGAVEDFTDPSGEITGISTITQNTPMPTWFSSKHTIAWEILSFRWSNTITKIRGEFNSFLGIDNPSLKFGQTYNIFQKNYNFNLYWKDYFKIRFNDSSQYSPISDRIVWSSLKTSKQTPTLYRGDCYICTYTHRMLWNFIDPELPTNTRIVDPWTWFKNYKVNFSNLQISGTIVMDDGAGNITGADTTLYHKKVLPLFTYKGLTEDGGNISTGKLILPDGSGFTKYSELAGSYGTSKMNRPDINAVGIGHWITFKICSNINLALRDLDFSRPDEESLFKRKRGFYPIQPISPYLKLPESNVINLGISKTTGSKAYFDIPEVPFTKTSFTNRIYYSEPLQASSFKNGNRIFKSVNYQDYTLEYGAITKLVEWYGKIIAIMEHGVLMIPVNERAIMSNEGGENVYINTDNILPKNPRVISNTFGSTWADSIIKTPRYIYGIDSIGKKIWRTDGESFECISDLKIQKFLNDNINLKVTDRDINVGKNFLKTHYNAFKQDIVFVFKYGDVEWSLCWSELLEKWITRYSWIPEFSENINNIFYTFANSEILNAQLNNNVFTKIYKHGFAGSLEETGNIKPTKWYDTIYPFEFEFVVIGVSGVQKIYDNLKIISNSTEPHSFEFEISGEGYDWNEYKNDIYTVGNKSFLDLTTSYKDYLTSSLTKKIPYIWIRPIDNSNNNWPNGSILKDLTLYKNNKTEEKLIRLFQKAMNIKTQGRLKGNMQYCEDSWDIQIQPISLKYAYLKNNDLALTNNVESRVRDKYIKIKVRYDGSKYAIISAIRTLFTISYA